jgi:small basic protein
MNGERVRESLSQQQVLAVGAVASAALGALSTAPIGTWARAVFLMVFVAVGVGSAVMCWLDVPAPAAIAGVVGLSVGGVMALSTSLAWLGGFRPAVSCWVLAAVVAMSGGARVWLSSRRESEVAQRDSDF